MSPSRPSLAYDIDDFDDDESEEDDIENHDNDDGDHDNDLSPMLIESEGIEYMCWLSLSISLCNTMKIYSQLRAI